MRVSLHIALKSPVETIRSLFDLMFVSGALPLTPAVFPHAKKTSHWFGAS